MPTFDVDFTSRGLNYDEETLEGTTDIPGAPTALTHMGITDSVTLTHMENPAFVRLSGGEDIYAMKGGPQFQTLMWDMSFFRMAELDYGIKANVGTGTINKSLFILGAVKINGSTTTYLEMNRSRFNQVVVSGAIGSELRGNITAFGKLVEPWPTTLPTNWTVASVPSTDPWGFDDSDSATPVAWGSYNPDIVSIDVSVSRNLLRRPTMSSSRGIAYNKPGPRDIRFTMMVGWDAQTAWNDMYGSTARTLAWTLEATPHAITGSTCKIYAMSDPINIRSITRGGNPAPYEVLQQVVGGAVSVTTS